MEYWDLFDAERKPLGRKCVRGDALSAGEYHLIAFALIFNGKDELLLTLRAPDKDRYPNFWGNTGGGVQAGESTRQAIVRETHEETGLRALPEEFTLLGTFLKPERHSITDLYLLRRDTPAEALVLQPGETVAAKWVSIDRVEEMIAAGEVAQPDAERWPQIRLQLLQWLAAGK